MSDIFIKIFNLGVSAGWLVLAILVCRPLMKKVPKWINCLLWGIVGLRLCLPFSLESIFSLVPSAEPLPEDIMMTQTPAINSGVSVLNDAINPIISTSLAPTVGASVNPMQIVIAIASWIWIAGIALMLGYGIVSYITLRIKVRVSVKGADGVYFCDEVDSPFILGVIRPRICVPSGMSGNALDHVLAHEKAHLSRGDHLWKPIGFAFLAFYWFNPLLWVAYALLCRDIEAACDEKVIKTMPAEAKKSYSEALLACSMHRKRIMACPLAFGEVGVKQRIKSVLNYKKPAFWIIIVALVATLVLSVCFLTNPVKNIRDYLDPGSEWVCAGDAIIAFGIEENGEIRGYVSFEGENYDVILATRAAGLVRGTRLYVGILKANSTDDAISEADVLLTGIMKKRGRDLVLEIQKDNLGLTEAELVFEKREDMGLVGTGGMHTSSVPPAEIGEDLFVYVIGYGTYSPDVGIELKGVRRDGDDVLFELQWTAKSENGCNIGPSFKVAMYLNGEPLKMVSYGSWEEIVAAIAGAGSTTCTYNITEHYNISEPGRYRFTCYDAWVEFQIVNTNYSAEAVYDTAVYDIDGDGRQEICEVGLGITSGAFTFTFRVSEPGEEAYEIYDVFYSDWMDFKFVLSDDGKLRLQGTTQGGEVRLYDIGIADGYVTLTNDGVPLMGLRQNNNTTDASVVFDPTYSHYDSSKKYDVYVWQMSKNGYSFALLESKERDWLDPELLGLRGVDASEMRQLLIQNNLGPNDVNIVPRQNPLSDYGFGDYWDRWIAMEDITPQKNLYLAMVHDMLFGAPERIYYPSIYESTYFDIDGDGVQEYNKIALGLDGDKFTLRYMVSEDGKTLAYDDTYEITPMGVKLYTDEGNLRLRGVTEDGAAHTYAIALEDGHVKLIGIEDTNSRELTEKLSLSVIDFSLVDRIVVTNGATGERAYLNKALDKANFKKILDAVKKIEATDPVSSRGYYGFTYHVELYYDYQPIYSFSLCPEADGASITCGYYETVGNFDYPARYKLTAPDYDHLAAVLANCFK